MTDDPKRQMGRLAFGPHGASGVFTPQQAPSEPRTEAGRTLLDSEYVAGGLRPRILAIEAEAARLALDGLRRAVEGLPYPSDLEARTLPGRRHIRPSPMRLYRAAVLVAIEEARGE